MTIVIELEETILRSTDVTQQQFVDDLHCVCGEFPGETLVVLGCRDRRWRLGVQVENSGVFLGVLEHVLANWGTVMEVT